MEQTLPTSIHLEIVTPERLVVREVVTAVTIPGKDGYLGILPGHAPLLTELQPGEMFYTRGEVTRYLSMSWGFAEVLPDRVIVLAQTSEHAEEIDVARAERARERAQERLKTYTDSHIDMARAQRAMDRAAARLAAASRAKGSPPPPR